VEYTIGYGITGQTFHIPDSCVMGCLLPNEIARSGDEQATVKEALDHPIGSKPLEEIVQPGKKIAIVTSDVTRPMPSQRVLPVLLDRLYRIGVDSRDITIVFALGSHRRQTEEEQRHLVGDEVFSSVRCIDSGEDTFDLMGTTPAGTPVEIAHTVASADFRICLGNIEYHYFAGYSGGAKAIMPGVSTRRAIQSNHKKMVEPAAVAGRLDGNPVREDIEAAARICPIHFLLNVVLDEHKQVIHAVAGDAIQAHRAGCRFLDTLYRKEIAHRADIVIASQGGAPKDLNLYQTQKALENAKYAVCKGGIIILVGSCAEGMGEKTFENWMVEAVKPSDLVDRVKKDFQLGGHKAAAIALVLENTEIDLVSEMKPDFVRSIFMNPFSTVQEALNQALQKAGPNARVLLMPYAGSTLPVAMDE